MVLSFDRYYSRTSTLDCPAIFYVVHNILIRKDMVRKSQFLSDLYLGASRAKTDLILTKKSRDKLIKRIIELESEDLL